MNRSRRTRKLGIDSHPRLSAAQNHAGTWLPRTGRTVATVLVLLPLLASCARTVAPAGHFPRLAEVRRVYVAPLGSSIDAEGIRDGIRQRLGESSRFIVVDESSADAILSGMAGVKQIESTGTQIDMETGILTTTSEKHRTGLRQLRLLAAGSRDTIWTFEYTRGWSLDGPTTRVAKQAVRRLLTDAATADSVRPMPGASRSTP
ncbi:MAG: hypothetical protein AABY85_12090 [Gemmatimonadota bacterium]